MSNIAVISLAGAQHLIKPGDKFEVNRLNVEAESSFDAEILLTTKGEEVLFREGKVETRVIEHKRGEKLHVVKFRAKSRFRRRIGHRQDLSLVEVVSINGEKKAPKAVKAAEVEPIVIDEAKPAKKVVAKKTATAKKVTKSKEVSK
jgi:large subunit ribosomal protein L21